MNKKLFKGTFNLVGQQFVLHTHSGDKEHAFLNFIHQLNNKTSMPKFHLYSCFDGRKDNYFIEEVRK